MKPTRPTWKIILATGTVLGAGFGGIAAASDAGISVPAITEQVEIIDAVIDDIDDANSILLVTASSGF